MITLCRPPGLQGARLGPRAAVLQQLAHGLAGAPHLDVQRHPPLEGLQLPAAGRPLCIAGAGVAAVLLGPLLQAGGGLQRGLHCLPVLPHSLLHCHCRPQLGIEPASLLQLRSHARILQLKLLALGLAVGAGEGQPGGDVTQGARRDAVQQPRCSCCKGRQRSRREGCVVHSMGLFGRV